MLHWQQASTSVTHTGLDAWRTVHLCVVACLADGTHSNCMLLVVCYTCIRHGGLRPGCSPAVTAHSGCCGVAGVVGSLVLCAPCEIQPGTPALCIRVQRQSYAAVFSVREFMRHVCAALFACALAVSCSVSKDQRVVHARVSTGRSACICDRGKWASATVKLCCPVSRFISAWGTWV